LIVARNIPSAAEAAAKWQSGFAGAGAAWQAGIEAVNVAPGQLAVAAQPRYLAGVQNNVGKWAARTGNVTLAQWKAASVAKGPSRLAQGASVGMAKYQARIQAVLDAEKSIIAGLPPRGDAIQNIERSRQFQLAMHQAFQSGG
jgi:hypothetical protein